MKNPVWTCAALGLAAIAAHAQEDVQDLTALIVTATRTEVPADQALAPVIVIGRDEIERSLAGDVAGLLRFHAGIDISRNGGPGQVTSVFIRGANSNQTLMMVDGVKINPATAGGASIQNIVPDVVERIEIVKGPRSSLYGSEAIGGVVNIITRRAGQSSGIEARAAGGRYNTREASAGGEFRGGKLALGARVHGLDTDGFPTLRGGTIDQGYSNLTLNGHANYELEHVALEARFWQARGETEYLDFFGAPLDQDYTERVGALAAGFRPLDNWQSLLTFSYLLDEIEQNQSDDHVRTRRNTVDWQNDFLLGEHQAVTAGLNLVDENTRSLSFGSRYDEDNDDWAVYLQDVIDIGRHSLVLAGRYTDYQTFGSETTWNADYGIRFLDQWRLRLSAGKGFRAPNGSELYGFGGNAELDPETSENYEIGLDFWPGSNQRISVSAFRNDIDDLIAYFVTDPATFAGENRNIDRARIEGVEASYDFQGSAWRLHIEGILQAPEDRRSGEQLLRRAKRSASINVNRRWQQGYQLGLDLLTTSRRKDFGFPSPVVLGAYTLLNLTGQYDFGDSWRIQARVENLLDEDYELADGYNTAGRGLYLALAYRSR